MFKGFRQSIANVFKKIETEQLPLRFEVELDEYGNHLVQVFSVKNGVKEKISDISKYWNYGSLPGNGNVGNNIITLSEEDRHTLYSLKSLNPELLKGGTLKFDIEPPVLKYIRTKKNVDENDASKELIISDKPLKPTIKIDYKPGKTLSIEAGYSTEEGKNLIPADHIKKTKTGNFTRIKNLFVPLEEVGEKVTKLLDQNITQVKYKDIPEFILRDLVSIKEESNAVLTDLAQQIRVFMKPLRPKVKVDKGESGWLNFQVDYEIAGKVISHQKLRSIQAEKYFALDDYTFVDFDQKTFSDTDNYLNNLNAEIIKGDLGYRIPATKFTSLEDFITDLGGKQELSKAYQEFISQLKDFDADETFQLGEKFESRLINSGFTIRPYQRSGIHWLTWLRENHLHGVLADDMGLGKTIQSLAALRLAYEASGSKKHSLVIAPKSVLYHWQRELQRCYPVRRSYIYHGSNRRKTVLKSSIPYVIITTYSTASRDIELLSEIPFYYLILDEATKIKNPAAVRTQAIKALNATHRVALSGTPVENRPAELWSLFDFLMKGHLGKHGTFVRVFEDQILAGDSKSVDRLGKKISPFLLRRNKGEVEKDLPEKLEVKEWCDLTTEQKQLYNELQKKTKAVYSSLKKGEYVNYTKSILPVLTWLKQICDHPAVYTKETKPISGRSNKFDWIMDKIDEILMEGEKVVVFSHFLDMLSLLEIKLKEKHHRYIRIDGSTNQRQQLIDDFNQGNAKVALLSLMAAGHGINMTAANHVIHADRWWNPAIEDQATDRVHRIGQKRTVFVYNILVENTLEERIDRLLEKKRDMSDQIIESARRTERNWTKAELIELLRPLD